MTTFIPETPDTASPTMSGKPETVTTETPTIIDFDEARKERTPLMERLPGNSEPGGRGLYVTSSRQECAPDFLIFFA